MAKGDHRVTPSGDGRWKHKKDGNEKASGIYETQEEAWDVAKEAAKNDGAEAVLHNRKGQFRERNSYGDDPYPPEG